MSAPTTGASAPGPTTPRLSRVKGRSARGWLDSAWAFVWRYPMITVAILAGVGARITFWAVTDRKFEDGLITVTHARNAADGTGLTHHLGEGGPVHGFTSALSVLVPLVGELIHSGGGFTALRLASLIAFAVTAIYAYRIGQRLGLGAVPMGFVLAYLAFDQNQIFYGMAGMETQIAVAILLAAAYHLMVKDTWRVGLLCGLALLVRPDFILFVGPALLYLLLTDRGAALRAGLTAFGVVLPWLIFTTAYYGSPVPNTIRAKSLRYPLDLPTLSSGPTGWLRWANDLSDKRHDVWHWFTPFLENGLISKGVFPEAFAVCIAFTFVVLAVMGVRASFRVPGWWPTIAFVVIFFAYEMVAVIVGYYEWYLPPFMAIVALLAGAGLQVAGRAVPKTAAALALALAVLFAMHMPFTFTLEGRVQHDVEDQVRTPLGEYLRASVPKGETVTSESAGYVGYYGRVRLIDFPGLTSKEGREAFARLGKDHRGFLEYIEAVRPDWLVMRSSELAALQQLKPAVAAQYQVQREFKAPRPVDLDVGGVQQINIDQDFIVLRRAIAR